MPFGYDFTFGYCSDCSRWSPELNQTKSKYLKGFQIYNFGLGLGGILHWKILFSFWPLWRQLLTYSGDLGTKDGQRTSIKWSSSHFLHLVVLLLQLLRNFFPQSWTNIKKKQTVLCRLPLFYFLYLSASSLCVLTILPMNPTSIHLGPLSPQSDNRLYLDVLFWVV